MTFIYILIYYIIIDLFYHLIRLFLKYKNQKRICYVSNRSLVIFIQRGIGILLQGIGNLLTNKEYSKKKKRNIKYYKNIN